MLRNVIAGETNIRSLSLSHVRHHAANSSRALRSSRASYEVTSTALPAATGAAAGGWWGAAAGSWLGGKVKGAAARVRTAQLVDIIADPLKRDDFYALVKQGGRGMSGAGKAYAVGRALMQLGVVSARDEATGGATADEIEAARKQPYGATPQQ